MNMTALADVRTRMSALDLSLEERTEAYSTIVLRPARYRMASAFTHMPEFRAFLTLPKNHNDNYRYWSERLAQGWW